MITLVLGTSTGGVGVHVLSLTRELTRAGWEVTVAGPPTTLAHFDFVAAGATTAVVPISGPGREALAVPALRRASQTAQLVHAHGLRAGVAAVLNRRRPLVVTWHNAVLADGWRGRVLEIGERLVATRATVNLGASADLVERIRQLGGGDVRLAPVAPPLPHPRRDAATVRAELGLSAGQPLVVCVGRLHPQKAHDVLIDAATRWRALDPVPLTVIAGSGPARAELQDRIDATGAPVRLLGHRDDVADLLAAADVVVLASRWEARPLVVQEAMQLGAAVVATDVGGIRDLVGDGAVLVPAAAAEALAAAVTELLSDPDRRAELGVAAGRVARMWPTEQESADRVMAVYRELLA